MTKRRLDPNRNAYRPDLADRRLEGQVQADRFADGVAACCRSGVAPIKARPNDASEQVNQLLYGETVEVFERRHGWAWARCDHDGYVGYVREEALDEALDPPTHRVLALRSFLFPEPGLKKPPLDALPLTAAIRVDGEDNGYLHLEGGGWLFAKHATTAERIADDPVATATRFIGVPYLWGGRSALGIDCSGLIQLCLAASAIAAPRDTYMQADELGDDIAIPKDPMKLRRGDLIFFPGHVGFYDGAGNLVHANGHDGMVSSHPLETVLERERRLRGNAITRVRRPASNGEIR